MPSNNCLYRPVIMFRDAAVRLVSNIIALWPTSNDLTAEFKTKLPTCNDFWLLISRFLITGLETRLQPNIGFTLGSVLAVFTCSAITPPKVNRFGWNLEHSEYIVGSWLRQILGAIRAVSIVREPGEILFLSGKQRTISPISRRRNLKILP